MNLKRYVTRVWMIAGLVTVLSMAMVAPAAAQISGGATGTAAAGSVSAAGSFSFAYAVDGKAGSGIYTAGTPAPSLSASDFNSETWHITMAAPALTDTATHTNQIGGAGVVLSVTPGAPTCQASTTCPSGNTLTAGSSTPITTGGATVYSVSSATDGAYDVPTTWALDLDGSQKAGAYSTTITVTFATP